MADDKKKKARKATPAVDPNWKPGEDVWEPVPVRMEQVDWTYTESEWFTPGHNEKGQSTRLSLRIAPEMERALDVMVSGKQWPYRTHGDLVRHALYRHLFLLHRLDPSADRHLLIVMDGILQQLRDDEMRQRIIEMFDLTKERIDYHVKQGNYDEAVRLALNELSRLEGSQPGHNRDMCIARIKSLMVPIAKTARELREQREKAKKNKVSVSMTNISALPDPEDDPED